MSLPDRRVVVERLDQMIESTTAALDAAPRWPDSPEVSPRYPALYLVGIQDHEDLRSIDAAGCDQAMREVSRRLDRLVRGSDVLGYTAAGTFALAAGSVTPESAGALVERIEGAAALPVAIGDDVVSLHAVVALAFAGGDVSGERLMQDAERDLERLQRD